MASIKIIDDDVEFAENLSVILKKQGHAVSLLDDTKAALEDLSQNKPDLLILDVMFPDNPCAGFDLARMIRRTPVLKHMPIIMLTGINQEFPMDFSKADIDPDWLPVQEFIEKPVDAAKLLKVANRLLKPKAK